jgi:hypothetical protein
LTNNRRSSSWSVSSAGSGQVIPAAAIRAKYSRTVLCEMLSSRDIARVAAPAPKCNVISRCIRRMDSLLVGIPHSIDCDGAVNASSMLTCETTPPAGRPIHLGGRLRQNGGRHQIGMLDGIRSERWAPSAQNARTVSVRTCTQVVDPMPNEV